MTGTDTWSRLTALVAAVSDRLPQAADLLPQHRLIEDVGLSSLMVVNLVVDLETAFDFVVREEDFDGLATMADLLRLVERKRAAARADASGADAAAAAEAAVAAAAPSGATPAA